MDEAVALERRSLELDPLNLAISSNLSLSYLLAGRLEEAEATVRRLMELSPDYLGARALLGRIHLAQGRPEAALAEIEQERSSFWHVFGRAVANDALGPREESETALRELRETYEFDAASASAEIYAARGEVEIAFIKMGFRATQRHDPGEHRKLFTCKVRACCRFL